MAREGGRVEARPRTGRGLLERGQEEAEGTQAWEDQEGGLSKVLLSNTRENPPTVHC